MLQYDENTRCLKCEKDLEYKIINYEYTHDGGIYENSYKQVDRQFAKKVGFGFYCNDSIKDGNIKSIIEDANKYLENDLAEAIDKVRSHYENKINQLNSIKDYIEKGIELIKDKNILSELSKEELEYLLQYNYIYNAYCQDIAIGFCPFELRTEVRKLFENYYKR